MVEALFDEKADDSVGGTENREWQPYQRSTGDSEGQAYKTKSPLRR
jgi:hypothetical protein